MRAMEHHASPPSSLIWLWLLVSFGEPLVTFLTTLFEGWSDYRKEVALLGAEVVHNSAYLLATMGGVECFILLLSGLRGRYSLFGHSCHNLWGIVTTAGVGGGRLNLCSLSLCNHLLVGVDDTFNLFRVFADTIGERSALNDVEVVKRDFYCGYLLIADVSGKGQRTFFEKIFG